MKKYIISLMILFAVHGCCAMELAKLSSENDSKCFEVARYLYKYPQGKNEEENKQINLFFNDKTPQRADLAESVLKYYSAFQSGSVHVFIECIPDRTITDHNAQNIFDQILLDKNNLPQDELKRVELLEKHNPLVALAFNKDVFIAQCQYYFPDSLEDNGGFFKAEFYEGAKNAEDIIYLPFGGNIKKPKKSNMNTSISRDDMINQLLKMPLVDAFFGFRYVTQRKVVQMVERFERSSENGCDGKGFRYKQSKLSHLSAQDLKCLTDINEALLKEIVEKSNEASKNSEDNGILHKDLFEIKEEHIKALQSIENIRELDCFKNPESPFNGALIYIKCKPSTITEKIKDKVLFGAPLLLTHVMPDLIHSQTTGFLQGVGGLCAAGVSGYILGFPVIDTYNSGRSKLSEFFGDDNHAKVDRRWLCFIAIAHYLPAVIAQKFLEWGTMPYQVLAGIIYVSKLFILRYLAMEDYNDPFKRSNKKGNHYTLGDLIQGPQFDKQ